MYTRGLSSLSVTHSLLLAAVAGLGLFPLACSSTPESEQVGSSRSFIKNGTPVANTGVPPYVVQIDVDQGATVAHGTGIVMNADTILTAGHVLYNEEKDQQSPPSAITVYRSLDQGTFKARSVFVHPTYRRVNMTVTHDTTTNKDKYTTKSNVFDVGVIKLKQPLTGILPSNLPQFTARSIATIVGPDLPFVYYGAGPSVPDGTDFAIRTMIPQKAKDWFGNAVGNYTPKYITTTGAVLTGGTEQALVQGDSGGPALGFTGTSNPSELLGIITALDETTKTEYATYAPSFKSWYDRVTLPNVKTTPFYYNALGVTTSGTAYTWLEGTVAMQRLEFTQLDTLWLEYPLNPLVPVVSIGAVGMLDLDKDNDLDLVIQLNEAVYTFINTPLLGIPSFAAGTAWSLPTGTVYSGFNAADTNGDGVLDILGIGADGKADVYLGTTQLGAITYTYDAAQTRYGFPSADSNDGKFVEVIGQGYASVAVPSSSFFLEIPGGTTTPQVVLDIFDGDLGGLNDAGSGTTCYRLYAAPNKEATSSSVPIITKSSATMPDAAWSNIYTGTATSAAKAASGNYFYRLDVALADDCNGNQLSTDNKSNLFKLRSNGQINKEFGDVVFEGADSEGDFASDTSFQYGNYEYDGTLDFYIDVGENGVVNPNAGPGEDTNQKELLLGDWDADDLEHPDFPGIADGANEEIGWNLYDPSSEWRSFADVVSGNYPTGNLGQTYSVTVDRPGTWTWRWHDVLTANAVQVTWQASPTQYAMYGAKVRRLTVSDAQPPVNWTGSLLASQFFPTVVGSKTSCSSGANRLAVSDVAGAQTVLANATTSYASLQAEALATKLNIKRSNLRSAGLEDAFVYGRSISVSEALAQAEAMLAAGPGGSTPQQQGNALRMLRGINHGEISYAGARGTAFAQGGLDSDNDGIRDEVDDCAAIANPSQEDFNLDGIGDACDPKPSVDCVVPDGKGGFTAFFNLTNRGPSVQVLRSSANVITGSGAKPPVLLRSGTQSRIVSAQSIGGAPVSWTIYGTSAVASLDSPRCLTADMARLPYANQAAIVANSELRIQNGVTITDCADLLTAAGTTFISGNATVGDVYSRGSVQVDAGANVQVVSTAGAVSRQNGAQVLGTLSVPAETFATFNWAVSFPTGSTTAINVERGIDRTLAPGAFARVDVKSGGLLRLSAGVYYFDTLTVEPDATIALDTSLGAVTVYVRQELTFRGRVTGASQAAQFVVAAFGANMSVVESSMRANLFVPNGTLMLGSSPGQRFTGRFVGNKVEVRAGSIVTRE